MQKCIVLVFAFVSFIECKEFYHNHTLFKAQPYNEEHLKFFQSLPEKYDVNFWQPPGSVNYTVQFTINPNDKQDFLRSAAEKNINVTTLIDDIQSAFDSQTVKAYIRRRTDTFDWDTFYRVDDIYGWLADLRAANPSHMKIETIGKTAERRNILAVRIRLRDTTTLPRIIIEGGIHAREWVSISFVTYLLHAILHAKDSSDTALKTMATSYEWYFVPVLNPDGYEYSHTDDRMWRKNRQKYGEAFGADINRNFGIAFGTVGIEKYAKADIYCGPKAFSEKESQAMAAFVRSKSSNLKFYFAFHSFGQFMIIPYAYSKSHHGNFDEVSKRCHGAAKEISLRYGTKYTVGTAFDTVGYVTSGVSGCWVKKMFSTPTVVTFELRDEGKYGFALPASQIRPTCVETVEGIKYLVNPSTPYTNRVLQEPMHSGQERNAVDVFVKILCNFLIVTYVVY